MDAEFKLMRPYMDLFTIPDSNGNVKWLQIIKEGLRLRGIDAGYCRKPVIDELPAEVEEKLKAVLKHFGYLN